MKKEIDFIELCELIDSNKQPDILTVDNVKYYWDGLTYTSKAGFHLNSAYRLRALLALTYEYEDSILTNSEREYLSAVIKPWKENVLNIFKDESNDKEFIAIFLENGEIVCLPYFAKGKYYEGMKLTHRYTVEELGL